MANFRFDGVNRHPAPQLPAFCRTRRTRRPITTTVRVSTLQQLQWLIWVLLVLQLSTILLLLSGPVPAPRRPQAGDPLAATDAAAAPVLSPSHR